MTKLERLKQAISLHPGRIVSRKRLQALGIIDTKNGTKWDFITNHYDVAYYQEGRSYKGFKIISTNDGNGKYSIPKAVRDHYKGATCVDIGTTANVEIDHKEGRGFNALDSSLVSTYQPLCKTANNAKREHCKKCVQTDQRFDATTIGYRQAITEGTMDYQGSCKGCYWFDVADFRGKL